MPAPIVRADHDALDRIASDFARGADDSSKLLQALKSKYEPLKSGGWIGRGATAYFNEQEGMVFPEFQRLQNALSLASRSTRQISKIFQDAAQEAAGMMTPFDGQGADGRGPAGPGGGQAGPGGGGQGGGVKGFLDRLKRWAGFPSNGFTIVQLVEAAKKGASRASRVVKFLANNRFIKFAARKLAVFDAGMSLVDFVRNPSWKRGADLAFSGLGVVGVFVSGPVGLVAGAAALGYWATNEFIVPRLKK